MKKILLLTVALLTTHVVVKADENHLYIQPHVGETLSWSVPSLQKMTFQDGNVVLTKKDGAVIYTPISSVGRMFVSSSSPQGIEQVAQQGALCAWKGDKLQINAQPGVSVKVYNVAGALVIDECLSGNPIDFHGLPQGLYIVKVGGQVFKTIKK